MPAEKREKRLTEKHFKSWDLQRIHRYIHTLPDGRGPPGWEYHSYNPKSILACFTLLTSYVLGCVVWVVLIRVFDRPGAVFGFPVWMYGSWYFAFFTNRTLMWAVNILYLPAPCAKNLLIDPDGNPEMCSLSDYPALEGYYGYRLPNAQDLEKIEKYLTLGKGHRW
jgi:hypothetical protein